MKPAIPFWERVYKTESCWLWTGATSSCGYGLLTRDKKQWRAHRYAWFITNGDPGDLWVLHRCDNPPCVNPNHLFLGTPKDNVDDKMTKGRFSNGNNTKTHCKWGHELSSYNLKLTKDGRRECRTCHNDRQKLYNSRRRTNIKVNYVLPYAKKGEGGLGN